MTRTLPWLTVANGLSFACGSGSPPDTLTGLYFPLSTGSRWTYHETRMGRDSIMLYKTISECASVTFTDCVSGDPVTFETSKHESTGSDDPEENGVSYIVSGPDGTFRVLQDMFDNCDTGACDLEFQQRYTAPGFLRFPGGRLDSGRTFRSTHTRCEIDCHVAEAACQEPRGAAPDAASAIEDKSYDWTIDGFEAVSVAAGDFPDALRVTRFNPDSGGTKRYWFVDGVGKVLEQEVDSEGSVQREEQLESFEIGTTDCGASSLSDS